MRRSIAEVPGNVERMIAKASTIEADVLLLDLEDSVPMTDEAKAQARELVGGFLRQGRHVAGEVAVRVNPPESPWFLDDMRWFAEQSATTLAVPKVGPLRDYVLVEELLARLERGSNTQVLLIVETPRCLLELERIAAEARLLSGLMVGAYDYTLACRAGAMSALGGLGTSFTQDHLVYLRQKVVATAAAYGLDAIDSPVLLDPKDAIGMRAETQRAKAWGFTGCTVIHPAMVAICNAAFSPTEDEAAWAQSIVEAAAQAESQGRAAFTLNGYTILPQHKALAEQIIARGGGDDR